MKKTTKVLGFILACTILFCLGLFLNWLDERPVMGAQEAVKVETSTPTKEIVENETSSPLKEISGVPNDNLDVSAPDIDILADMQRGALLTEEVRNRLILAHEQTVSGITLQVSDVILSGSRAYIRICMDSEKTTEPLMFGTSRLLLLSQEWIDAYIHFDEPKQTPGLGTCLIMEYWGIPEIRAKTADFKMSWVGLEIPDEGRYCEAYYRRAKADQFLFNNGIEIVCEEINGALEIQITRNDKQLDKNLVYGMVQEVVGGVTDGPWEFEVSLLNQN